jgi:hypothetical protein
MQEGMDELARRIEDAGRGDSSDLRGPVTLFAEVTDAFARLQAVFAQRRLHNGRGASAGAWLANGRAFLDAFPILAKLAACRRLAYALLRAGVPPQEVPALHRLCDWLDGGPWLATFGRDDRLQSDLFRRRLTELRERLADDARAALDLLICWLEATQEPGEPPARLLDADRAWWLSHDAAPGWPDDLAPLANELAAAATRGDWAGAAASAGVMVRRLREGLPAPGWHGRELQDCLHRLAKRD